MSRGGRLKNLIFNNFSYKMISLVISLILWFTILGRRDFTMTKTIELEVLPPTGLVVGQISTDTIKLKVSGPRNALMRFMENNANQVLVLDLGMGHEGTQEIVIPPEKIDIPFGVKVISIKPLSLVVRFDSKK